MLMLLSRILIGLDGIEKCAVGISKKFDDDKPAEDILGDAQLLEKQLTDLAVLLPDSGWAAKARGHASWMVTRLAQNAKNLCGGDIKDILQYDLPALRSSLYAWMKKPDYIDATLVKQVAPLLCPQQLDSAVRKSFVILKDRFVRQFGLDKKLDGQKLVSAVFGANSTLMGSMPPGEKEAYRNYFAGLFALERNPHAHNNLTGSFTETDAVISAVNLGLHLLDKFAKKKP